MLKEEEEKIIAEKIKSGLMSRKSLKQISKDLSILKNSVPEFIEFIVKDVSSFQKKIRDGLNWIDDHSKKSFNKSFIDSTINEQKEILNSVAYPKNNKSKEEEFFSTFRDLVVTGYFTSEVGIKDFEILPKDICKKTLK